MHEVHITIHLAHQLFPPDQHLLQSSLLKMMLVIRSIIQPHLVNIRPWIDWMCSGTT